MVGGERPAGGLRWRGSSWNTAIWCHCVLVPSPREPATVLNHRCHQTLARRGRRARGGAPAADAAGLVGAALARVHARLSPGAPLRSSCKPHAPAQPSSMRCLKPTRRAAAAAAATQQLAVGRRRRHAWPRARAPAVVAPPLPPSQQQLAAPLSARSLQATTMADFPASAHDALALDGLLTPEERAVRDRARAFMVRRGACCAVQPRVDACRAAVCSCCAVQPRVHACRAAVCLQTAAAAIAAACACMRVQAAACLQLCMERPAAALEAPP